MSAAGVKGPQLADLVGTTKQQISKLRRGDRKMTVEWARRLAPHLNVAWKELIEEQPTANRPAKQELADPLKRQSFAFDALDKRAREVVLRLARSITRRKYSFNDPHALEVYAQDYAVAFATGFATAYAEMNALREERDKLKGAMEQIYKSTLEHVDPTTVTKVTRLQQQTANSNAEHTNFTSVLSDSRKAAEFSLLVKREAARLLKTPATG